MGCMETAKQQDQKKRGDRRFLETMGFLVAKGFLRTNYYIRPLPNKHLRIEDAIWAGQNVEPRILEVLPAAVLRLGKHFDLDQNGRPDLVRVVDQLRRGEVRGDPFCNIPYEKLKIWTEFPLQDKRVKPVSEKKIMKTFRLSPAAAQRLDELARATVCSEASVLERLILTPTGTS